MSQNVGKKESFLTKISLRCCRVTTDEGKKKHILSFSSTNDGPAIRELTLSIPFSISIMRDTNGQAWQPGEKDSSCVSMTRMLYQQ